MCEVWVLLPNGSRGQVFILLRASAGAVPSEGPAAPEEFDTKTRLQKLREEEVDLRAHLYQLREEEEHMARAFKERVWPPLP